MSEDQAVELMRTALWMAFVVGAPILLIGFVTGIAVSLVQVLTSMQDPAFNTVPRLFVFLASTLLLLPWMTGKMIVYTRDILAQIGSPGG